MGKEISFSKVVLQSDDRSCESKQTPALNKTVSFLDFHPGVRSFDPVIEDSPLTMLVLKGPTLMAAADVQHSKSTYFGKWTVRGRGSAVDNMSWEVKCWSVSVTGRGATEVMYPETQHFSVTSVLL